MTSTRIAAAAADANGIRSLFYTHSGHADCVSRMKRKRKCST